MSSGFLKGAKGLEFKRHRPKDPLDVGFTIKGWKIRWIGSRQTEDKFGRIWKVLRRQDMPEALVHDLEATNMGIFNNGDTIRKGDLVLSYAPDEANDALRKELNKAAKDMEQSILANPSRHVKVDMKETSISKEGAENFRS